MDHVVYLDIKAKEMDNLLNGSKTMIIRGAAGRKMPYGRVNSDDVLYFINNNAEGEVKAKATVKSVLNSEKLSKEESISIINSHQDKLRLTKEQFKRWSGKRYLVLIEIEDFISIEPFTINKSSYNNMDDWLQVEDIKNVMI